MWLIDVAGTRSWISAFHSKRELLDASLWVGVIEFCALTAVLMKLLTNDQNVSLYSSVVERWSCKPAVVSSNLTGGNSVFKLIGYVSRVIGLHLTIVDFGFKKS